MRRAGGLEIDMTSFSKGMALATACAFALTMVSSAKIAIAAGDALAAGNNDDGVVEPAAKPKPAAGTKQPLPKGHPAVGNAGQPLPYPGGMIERHAKQLGLDDAAVKKMRSIVEMSRTENEKLRKQVEVEQGTLRKMLEQDVPDEKAVMAQADKIGGLVTQQRKNQLSAVLKIRGMLTPEQRAELEKLRREGPGAAPKAAK
jgi:Spy/CpxP family protein refolding chaperone